MKWTWTYLTSTGDPVEPLPAAATSEQFPSQADAESWLGENFRALLEGGVDNVRLDNVISENEFVNIYTMSLHPDA